MGLASALSTALTGLTAAESTIDVVGNNLANSSTTGFKASRVEFATQFLQTLSLGSAPVGNSGGTNPRQIGLGTQVASITPDFTQGTIQLSSNPSDLAIQGDGFFIVQATTGEQLYTRNGNFRTNAENQLVTTTGNKLLGYGVDQNFQIQTTTLEPLTIPLGSKAVAQATENVTLTGNLTPTGALANTAEIIQSEVLGDNSYAIPPSGTVVNDALAPNVGLTSAMAGGGAGSLNGTFTYKIVFVDANGNESTAATLTATAANQAQIDFTGIPKDTGGNYVGRRIYRAAADQTTDFHLVGDLTDNTTTIFSDTTADGALGALPAFDGSAINGNYSYYVTWSAPGVSESRPSPLVGPLNISDGRVLLSSLPAPTGQYNIPGSRINIYRNVTGQPDTFYRVTQIDPATDPELSFVDGVSDATITSTNPAVNPNYAVLDPDGPKIGTNSLLTNVTSRSGNTYTNLFQPGSLSFTGLKGERTLVPKTFQVTNTSTVQDLIDFMTQSLGIQPPGADSLNTIPNDVTSQPPGGSVLADGRIQLVGNNGVGNAISIANTSNGSAFSLTPTGGQPSGLDLGFNSTQTAVGQSAGGDILVYDSLGTPLNVHVTAVMESRDSSATVYRWFADSSDNDPLTGANIAVGTGLIRFDSQGNVSAVTNSTVSIDRDHESSVSPLTFSLDFSSVSGLASDTSTLNASAQDGFAPGTLSSFIVGEDGKITGVFTNGVSRTLGQVVLARFANPVGLQARGNNNFSAGVNSGLPIIGNPGTQGIGTITAGAVELSNTDIGKNLIDLILASTAYRGNTRVITTVDQMLQELLALQR